MAINKKLNTKANKRFVFNVEKYYSGLTSDHVKKLITQVVGLEKSYFALIFLLAKIITLSVLLNMHDKLIDRIKEKDYQKFILQQDEDSNTDVNN